MEKTDSPATGGGKGGPRSGTFDLTAVQVVSVDDLTLDPGNVRSHPQRNLDAMIGSLKRFGQQKPIVVDRDGVVRAGNGLLRAARLLGWSHVAAYMTELDGAEATAFAIADNRTAELSEWDDSALVRQVQSLLDEGVDLDAVGFSEDEITDLLVKMGENLPEGDGDIFGEFGDADLLDDSFVRFKFGQFEGRVAADIYEAFEKRIETGRQGGEVMLDDTLREVFGA